MMPLLTAGVSTAEVMLGRHSYRCLDLLWPGEGNATQVADLQCVQRKAYSKESREVQLSADSSVMFQNFYLGVLKGFL